MQSLIYLSDKHPFWKVLADNDKRLRFIITPFMQFICANYFIESFGKQPSNINDDFVLKVTRIFIPLLRKTVKGDMTTQRANAVSCKNHIKSWYQKYSHINDMFDEEKGKAWQRHILETKAEKNKKKKEQKKDEEEKPIDTESLGEKIKNIKLIKSVKASFESCIAKWTNFVIDIILNGLTDEIRPFKPSADKTERESIDFDSVLPIPATSGNTEFLNESFYQKTIRLWSRMLIYATYYNTGSMNESIRAVISGFVRYFIWEKKDSDGEPSLFIYNIQQTKELTKFPYNQWLVDQPEIGRSNKTTGINAKTWFKSLYLTFIKPELNMTCSHKNLLYMLKVLYDGGIELNTYTRDCRPLRSFDNGIDSMFNDVIASFALERDIPPVELDPVTSRFFPMRNGFLEFDANTGETKFHTDNYTRFMRGCTNVIWDDNYDYNSYIYQRCELMWNQIYPIPEESIYMKRMFASTLHGIGLRDQLLELYGSGAEGKSLICNFMMAMLGSDSIGKYGVLDVVNKAGQAYKLNIENPAGLSTTMKTETILIAQKGGHDEGGIIQLKDKRFCSLQEPNTEVSNGKLNDSIIKDITSGASSSGRHIYGRIKSFIVNALVVIQTNTMLAYSEDTDAMRRRMSVVVHRSKFQTAANRERTKSLKYVFTADPTLNTEINTNPLYWQALFYMLLPHAKELIREKMLPISGIPKPLSVIKSTDDSFTNSNGLIGWMSEHIHKCDNILQVSKVIEDIIAFHRSVPRNGILSEFKGEKWKSIIFDQLLGKYMGSIYTIKAEFFNNSSKGSRGYSHIKLQENLIIDIEKDIETNGLEYAKQKYLAEAITNGGASKMKSTFEDLFMFGYDDDTDEE